MAKDVQEPVRKDEKTAPEPVAPYNPEEPEVPEIATQKLYNPNDGVTGRPPSVYLDEVELRDAEVARAKVEGREPNFDNMPGSAGVRLVTADKLLAAHVTSTVGVSTYDSTGTLAKMIEINAANPDLGVNPVWDPEKV